VCVHAGQDPGGSALHTDAENKALLLAEGKVRPSPSQSVFISHKVLIKGF